MARSLYLGERIRSWFLRAFAVLVLLFLIAPILVIIPLSLNVEPYFTFTDRMLRLDPEGYSLRWYQEVLQNDQWTTALKNSLIVGIGATIPATILGTLAALGLARAELPFRKTITAIIMSPLIVPVIIVAASMYFAFSPMRLTQTYFGLVLAHIALGAPFVVITVSAALASFDPILLRAAASLGAGPIRSFFQVMLPLISTGVVSGALFAFVTSFDEVVVALFIAGVEQRTIPMQMWSGIRDNITPALLAAATLVFLISAALLVVVEMLKRRSASLRSA